MRILNGQRSNLRQALIPTLYRETLVVRPFFEDQGFQCAYRGLVTGLPTTQELLTEVEDKVRVKKGQPVDISINPSQLGKMMSQPLLNQTRVPRKLIHQHFCSLLK